MSAATGSGIGRRAALGAAASLGAAALGTARRPRAASGLRIGYVSPQTGPLAPFAEADAFVLAGVRKALSGGLASGGSTYPVEILVKDSQSNPNRAATVANELILGDGVDIMVVASTPETTNPVSDQCELAGLPCLSTIAPWQPWFFTRGGDPKVGFDWSYHFFWGLEDVIAVYTDMWSQLSTNRVVGGLFPNDGDGNAWGDPKLGFPPVLSAKGYTLLDPGRYQDLSTDFSAQISAFRSRQAEILTGVVIPPDFATFWTQARQQGFAPKIASVAKALLFPVAVEALGDAGNNLSSEVWWTPSHPFHSSLTGASAAELGAAWTAATGRQWTQCLGFIHAQFELAADALKRSGAPKDREAVARAIAATRLETVVGPIDFSKGPVRNVAKTPLVGGQWRRVRDGAFKYDLRITSNATAPMIAVQDRMQPIG